MIVSVKKCGFIRLVVVYNTVLLDCTGKLFIWLDVYSTYPHHGANEG